MTSPTPPASPGADVPRSTPKPSAPGAVTAAAPSVADVAPSEDASALREHEAYGAIGSLAVQKIAVAVKDRLPKGSAVLVQDMDGLAALTAYLQFCERTRLLADLYRGIARPTAPRLAVDEAARVGVALGTGVQAVLGSAKEILGAVADIVAFFKPDRRVSTAPLTVADETLAADVCGYLAHLTIEKDVGDADWSPAFRVYYPPLFPPEAATGADDLACVIVRLGAVADARRDAAERITQLDDDAKAAELAQLGHVDGLAAALRESLFGAPRSPAGEGDGSPAAAATTPLSRDDSLLTQLIRGATRRRLIGETGHVLFLKLVRVGGIELLTKRKLLADSHEFRGMAVASYFLFRPDGTLASAGTERHLTPAVER